MKAGRGTTAGQKACMSLEDAKFPFVPSLAT